MGNIIAGIGALISLGGLAFGLIKWVQAQVTSARTDLEKDVARLEGRIESVRVECARRDDIAALARNVDVLSGRFDTGISGINNRIDQVLSFVAGKSAA